MYVPEFVLLIVDGVQFPVIPLLDTDGNVGAVDPLQIVEGKLNVGDDPEVTVTVKGVLVLLSQPVLDCETQYVVTPGVAVEGVGAVVDPTPPVAEVNHNMPIPLAVNGTADVP